MIYSELKAALDTIEGSTNPEIHHYRRGSHPGIKYYIKTILPGPYIINKDTAPIWKFWNELSCVHPRLIKLIECAYDWEGNSINGWWTIWLENRIDIQWTFLKTSVIDYKIVEYEIGLKLSAETAVDTLNSITNRHSEDDHACYEKLKDISLFLSTYTSDDMAERKRKKFMVISDDNLQDDTLN